MPPEILDVRGERAKGIVARHLADLEKLGPIGPPLLAKIEAVIGGCDARNRPLLDYVRTVRFLPAGTDPKTVLAPPEQAWLILGLLLGRDVHGGLHQAIHFYMALISGVSTDQLAHALLVAQIYTGLSGYTAALRTLSELLLVMEGLPADGGPAGALDALLAHWGSY